MIGSESSQYLGDEFSYNFHAGPELVRSREDAIHHGLNCVALVHLISKELLDIELPPDLNCYELFADRKYTEGVSALSIEEGDLVWFGLSRAKFSYSEFTPSYKGGDLKNWKDQPLRHVGIVAGFSDDEPQIIHSTHVEGTNTIWPISRFADYKRYASVYGFDRLKSS